MTSSSARRCVACTSSAFSARPGRRDATKVRGEHGRGAVPDADRAAGRAGAACPSDLRGAAARAAARLARPDDRLDCAADDRRRPRRSQHLSWVVTAYLLASTVSARSTASSATSTAARSFSRPRSCSSWSARCCAGSPEHDPADRVPRGAGPRRRRPDGADDGGSRRHLLAARTRPLPGLLRRGLRRLDRDRAAARRLLRRQPLLALDLLRQRAARRGGAGRDRDRLPRPQRARPARIDYLGAAFLAAGLSAIVLFTSLGGTTYGWGSPPILRWPSRRRAAGRLPVRRAPGRRADPSARALPQPNLRGHERHRLHRRPRALRRDHLPAALPPGRRGRQPDELRPHPRSADGRPPRHVHPERPADQPLRPLPAVSDRRHRDHDRVGLPALAPHVETPMWKTIASWSSSASASAW